MLHVKYAVLYNTILQAFFSVFIFIFFFLPESIPGFCFYLYYMYNIYLCLPLFFFFNDYSVLYRYNSSSFFNVHLLVGFFLHFFSFCCQKKAIVTNLQMVHRFFLACVQSEEKFLEMELSDQIEYQYYFSNCQVTIHSFTTLRQTTAWFLDVYFFILS